MSPYELWCYIAGGSSYFSTDIDPSKSLGDLKRLIYNNQKNGLSGVHEGGLTLFQVSRSGVPCSH